MLKYLFDRILALLGLVIFSPVLLVVALLIRVKMPDGPVLFRQVRIGRDGKPFSLVKFRTMTGDQTGETVTVAGDPRITPLERNSAGTSWTSSPSCGTSSSAT